MATTTRWWTAADLDGMPEDGCRYEVLEGELLVTPSPARGHSIVTVRLGELLSAYCRAHAVGDVMALGVVRWKANALQPDLMVSSFEPWHTRWEASALPLLVVEIHSPSTQLRDRGTKRLAYMNLGIPEYWQVDIDQRVIRVTRPHQDEVLATSMLEWRPKPQIPTLTIDLPRVFDQNDTGRR